MTGLEAIVAKIIEDANTVAAARVSSAKLTAQQIREDRRQIARDRRKQRLDAASEQVKRIGMRGLSSIKSERSKLLLAQRNQLIDSVLNQALLSLEDTSPEEAFERIESRVLSCPISGPASLILSAKDLNRLPKDFSLSLSQRMPFPVSIQTVPGDFTFGCIVVCGDVEYDYTAEGILYEQRDELRDLINLTLFSEEAGGAN